MKRSATHPRPSASSAVRLRAVRSVALDAYGTLFDFTEPDFIGAMAEICGQQGLQADASDVWKRFLRASLALRSKFFGLRNLQVIVYEGTSVGGKVASSGPATIASGSWTYTSKQLKDGTYTAQAEQSDEAGNTGLSSPQTFTVKTAKPVVTLNPPQAQSNNATPSFSGSADTGPGDIQSVTLKIYSGSEPSGSALQTLTVQASGGKWQAGPVAHLPDGTYTAQAE